MKSINPGAYNVVVDPKSGRTHLVPDQTARAIEYSDQELKTMIDLNLLPSNLRKAGLDLLKKIKKDLNDQKKFFKKYPTPTHDDFLNWYKSRGSSFDINKMNAEIALLDFILKNEQKLKEALEGTISDPQTFAIPSQDIMFSLLAMFAGKPERIPRKLLETPYNKRSVEEQKEADDYLSAIFQKTTEFDYTDGIEKSSENLVALICDNPKIEAKAKIEIDLFRRNSLFREEQLAHYIKRTFGAEGMRHLLGLIIGLEENFRKGNFEWTVNDHLERLGYKKKARGNFDPDLKKTASEIIKIFTGLCITSVRKEGKKGSLKGKFLFMVSDFEIQTFQREIIDERINLVATDFWYSNAFSNNDKKVPQYTKLLKEIAKEDHREHPLTIYLAPLLAVFWRINSERKFKVKHLMEWCDLKTDGKYKSENLRDLTAELNYMKDKNYLGNWTIEGISKIPSQCTNPYECIITLNPPDWLSKELTLIKQKREIPALQQKQVILSLPEFKTILEESKLSKKDFATAIGVTRPLITAIINGKRKITPETSHKISLFQQKIKQPVL